MTSISMRESADAWDLQADRKLAEGLQQCSATILASLETLKASLAELHTGSGRLSGDTSDAMAGFDLLSHSRFTEQTISSQSPTRITGGETREQPSSSLLTTDTAAFTSPSNEQTEKMQHDPIARVRHCLGLAAAAFREPSPADEIKLMLPHIYGSPEYLQDPSCGLDPGLRDPANSVLPPLPAPDATPSSAAGSVAAGSTSADNRDFMSAAEATSSVSVSEFSAALVTDFQSMLEAALRGESPVSHLQVPGLLPNASIRQEAAESEFGTSALSQTQLETEARPATTSTSQHGRPRRSKLPSLFDDDDEAYPGNALPESGPPAHDPA